MLTGSQTGSIVDLPRILLRKVFVMLRFLALVFLLSSSLCVSSLAFGALVTFEGLLSNPNSFYNGGPNTNNNGFAIGDVYFPNDYIATFGAWDGWAYSNVVNTTTQSFTNQYAAWPGMGSNGSSTYGLGYVFQPTYVSFATRSPSSRPTWPIRPGRP